jgi:hypothetical protein
MGWWGQVEPLSSPTQSLEKRTGSEARRSNQGPLPLKVPVTEGPLWAVQISDPKICMGSRWVGEGREGSLEA